MTLRKLKPEEHIKTRILWEDVFKEDTKEFLDYYYSVKALENEIYVIEEHGKIVSMLHLNPYRMRIGEMIRQTHYIVAVATDEKYRKKGYMSALLNHAMQVMNDRGEPLTFLMPAAEAIYKPFGFEFIYEQKRGKIKGICHDEKGLEFVLANVSDCQHIADFANELLKEYDVVTWRDADYYKTLLEEQESEQGGVLLIKRQGKLEGVFCFAMGQHEQEKRIEIREPLCKKNEYLGYAAYYLTGSETEEVFCTGYGQKTKPMIMARVFQPEFSDTLKTAKVFLNEVV